MERKVVFRTDIGQMREENQDAGGYERLAENAYLLVVADGMGGYTGGAEAARLVLEGITSHITSLSLDELRRKPFEAMEEGVSKANRMIQKMASEHPDLKDMGSTCVCALVLDDLAYFLHVGDSRAYLLRKGEMRQITEDHTVVEELVRAGYVREEDAPYHPSAGILTKCVGQMHSPQPERDGPIHLEEGDVLLLCSDGLYGMLDDLDMAEVVFTESPERAGAYLIEMANRAGGYDNITLILYYHGRLPEEARQWEVKVGRPFYESKWQRDTTTVTLPYLPAVEGEMGLETSRKLLVAAIILAGLLVLAGVIWYMVSF